MKKDNKQSLSKYEIACVSTGVPATGDVHLDRIITQGLRFKTAVQILESLVSSGNHHGELGALIPISIRGADAMIEQFRKSPDA